ncbi:flippase [Candidatus Woesearchaeota archaeon]|nr:flippase [Candidatus Woesearchaeota archaeon]
MEDKNIKAIAKGAIILLLGSIVGKLFAFFYRIILSRLGEQAYGEISLGMALFGLLSVISILGLDTGILRFISTARTENNPQKIKGTLLYASKIIFFLGLLFSILLFFLSDWIANTFFHTENLAIILKALAFALPLDGLRSILSNAFKAFQKLEYDIYGRVITESFTKIILTLLFIYLGMGVFGAALAYSFSVVLSFIMLFFYLEKKTFSVLNQKIEALYNKRELLNYSLPLVFNSLTIIIIAWADTLMLGYFADTATVGIYNVAIPTAKLILIFPTAFASLYLPIIAGLYANTEEFKKIYYTTTKWIVLINGLCFAWLIIYGKELVSTFFGANYTAAYLPLVILSIGYFINGAIYTSRDILLLTKKTRLIFGITTISCILNIILNIILIPSWGMLGAAASSSIALIFMSLAFLFYAKKEAKSQPFRGKVPRITLIIILSALATKLLTNQINWKKTYFLIAASIILMTMFCFLLFYITKTLEEEDKNMIKVIQSKLKGILQWK